VPKVHAHSVWIGRDETDCSGIRSSSLLVATTLGLWWLRLRISFIVLLCNRRGSLLLGGLCLGLGGLRNLGVRLIFGGSSALGLGAWFLGWWSFGFCFRFILDGFLLGGLSTLLLGRWSLILLFVLSSLLGLALLLRGLVVVILLGTSTFLRGSLGWRDRLFVVLLVDLLDKSNIRSLGNYTSASPFFVLGFLGVGFLNPFMPGRLASTSFGASVGESSTLILMGPHRGQGNNSRLGCIIGQQHFNRC
jgi:hypothetical protein